MNYGCIYVATNTATMEQYVGQTRQKPEVRFYAHKISSYKPKSKFHAAIAEYGYDVFTFQIVLIAFDKPALDAFEKQLIAELKPAYNMTRGGSGVPGPVSDAVRAARSTAAKARWANPEWRARTIAALRAAAAAGKFDESGRKIAAYNGGRTRWAGHIKVKRARRSRAESIKASWVDPDVRAKRIAGIRAAAARPEFKAKHRAARCGQKMPLEAVRKSAQAKHKPVYCPELGVTFLSQQRAAGFIGVCTSAVSAAIARKGKVNGMYTLVRV